MTDYIKSEALLLVLLNPFLVIIYLVDMAPRLLYGRLPPGDGWDSLRHGRRND